MNSSFVRTLIFAAALGAASPALSQAAPQSGDSAGSGAVLKKPVTGEEVYQQVCQACHMADGKGGTGAATIPALAGNPRLAAPAYPVMMVINGRGAMPGFTDMLGAAQIAGVATYVRTHFGNTFAKPVTVDDVKPFLTAKK